MTTASTRPATKNAAKTTDVKSAETPETVPNDVVSDNTVAEKEVNRIPDYLASNSILEDFCKRYLGVLDEISEYNKAVLAEKSSEWNAHKVFEKARELARPTDKNVKPNDEIKKALETYENLITETAKARKAALDATSKELGITLSATAERNPELEAPLKEKRKLANTIGTQLSQIATMTSDAEATAAVTEFLAKNPLPAIGRDQVSTFGTDGTTSTPKYRVKVTITNKDGVEILNEDGFTKTALALTKPVFGYERGEAPKADKLREAWEKAGNSATNVVSPVEFDDNNLHFTITKK